MVVPFRQFGNDDEHNDSNMPGNAALESLSVFSNKTCENVESPNGNKIQACEDQVCFLGNILADAKSK